MPGEAGDRGTASRGTGQPAKIPNVRSALRVPNRPSRWPQGQHLNVGGKAAAARGPSTFAWTFGVLTASRLSVLVLPSNAMVILCIDTAIRKILNPFSRLRVIFSWRAAHSVL